MKKHCKIHHKSHFLLRSWEKLCSCLESKEPAERCISRSSGQQFQIWVPASLPPQTRWLDANHFSSLSDWCLTGKKRPDIGYGPVLTSMMVLLILTSMMLILEVTNVVWPPKTAEFLETFSNRSDAQVDHLTRGITGDHWSHTHKGLRVIGVKNKFCYSLISTILKKKIHFPLYVLLLCSPSKQKSMKDSSLLNCLQFLLSLKITAGRLHLCHSTPLKLLLSESTKTSTLLNPIVDSQVSSYMTFLYPLHLDIVSSLGFHDTLSSFF